MSDIENHSDNFSRIHAEGGDEAPAEAMEMEAMEALMEPEETELTPEQLEK